MTATERRELAARLYIAQKGKCKACRAFFPKLTVDHIIPGSAGGADEACNIQLLCKSCNSRKLHWIAPGTQGTIFDTAPPATVSEKRRLQNNAKMVTLRAKAREDGVCITCRRVAVEPPKTTCWDCGNRANQWRTKQRLKGIA